MARLARLEIAGGWYHVISRGHQRYAGQTALAASPAGVAGLRVEFVSRLCRFACSLGHLLSAICYLLFSEPLAS